MEKLSSSRIIKPVHPKVTKIRMYLRPSSPIRVVKDPYQPKTGCLLVKPSPSPQLQFKFDSNSPCKKEINLNLNLNKMRNSRSSIAVGAS